MKGLFSLAKILYKCKDVGETENVPVADPGHYADYSASLTFPDPQKHLGWWNCHIRPDWVSIGICICIISFLFVSVYLYFKSSRPP